MIAHLVLFHRRAKRRLPQPRRSRFCGGSATPPSRSRSRLACRRRPSAAFCAALASTGSQPSSRRSRSGATSARSQASSFISISRSLDASVRWAIGSPDDKQASVNRRRGIGWEFVHVCIDDASRIAFSQVMKDEKKESAVAFLKAAVAYYASLGVRIERVMTDNGSCYRSKAFARTCKFLGLKHIRTKPYTPKTNGKAERFIQTSLREWAYALRLQHLRRAHRRTAQMAPPLQLASASW